MKKMLLRVRQFFAAHRPSKRRLIQLYAALLFNANLKGFATGRIYKGPTKGLCTPGLNCYSCPGATTACPLGALQNSLSASGARMPYYIFGILLLYGLLLGRAICSFLCPFGLLQELLHKIKTPKLKKSRFTRWLSYLKYLLLAVLVILYPLLFMLKDGTLPAFCKYVCPAGTLEGALSLLSYVGNSDMFRMLGPLFTWKFVLLVVFLVGSVFVYRFFCRFFCPLGAIYGLFNRFCLLGMRVEEEKCIDCGLCTGYCGMDVRRVGDCECIQCGECAAVCPTGAITRKGSRLFLPPNEIEAPATPSKKPGHKKRMRVVLCSVMALVLIVSLVYYNFLDTSIPTTPSDGVHGSAVGDLCYDLTVPLYGEGNEAYTLSANRGRVTIINFWGVWCAPCKEELPAFSAIAADYADRATVLAIHSALDAVQAPDYIAEYYPNSPMLFGQDTETDAFYTLLGGKDSYPITVVLDGNGFVLARFEGKVSYKTLAALIEGQR
jgi:ferredoxin